MCYFMSQRVSKSTLIKLKNIEKQLGTLAALQVLNDGFKYGNIIVIKNRNGNDFDVVEMHWEFIPYWTKSMDELMATRKKGIPFLNAKGETLLESKMFRDAALKRRCLVPVSNFYEWRSFKPEGEKKEIAYPYSIDVKGQEYFYIAAIWQPWTDKTTGEVLETVALVTTAANSLMEQIHNKKKRQPTILPEDKAAEWLFGNPDEEKIKELATYQLPSGMMQAHTISKLFKAASDPTEYFLYKELPELK